MHSLKFRFVFALAFAGALVAADDLPKGDAILDKYVEATGGKAAYAKLHTLIINGTTEFKAMGLKGKTTIYSAEPDKNYTEIEFAGIGKMQEGDNGDVAWGFSAMQGPRIKDGPERTEARLHGKFNSELNWRDIFKSAETAGVETIDGKTCYKVLLTPKEGPVMTRWFDKDTGYLVKQAATSTTPMGEIQSETMYSDYRKEGDLVTWHKMDTKVATMEINMTVDSVQLNPEIPKTKFDPPDQVKALIKKQ